MLSEEEQKILYNYYIDKKLTNIINFINNRDDLENIKNAIINAKKGFNFDITNLKLENVKEREQFSKLNGYEAKKLGRKIKLRNNWNDYRIKAMKIAFFT